LCCLTTKRRRKLCVWISEDLYEAEAIIAIAPAKTKKVKGSIQESLEEIIRDYIEGRREV